MMILSGLAAALSLVAAAITSTQTMLTLLFRRRRSFFRPGPRPARDWAGRSRRGDSFRRPSVSIVKPLCGLDDCLESNLESFANLRDIDYEVVLSVADPDDPALAVADRVVRRNPGVQWKVIVGGEPALERGNRKVARLVAAMPQAAGEVILISDSNTRVRPRDVARTLRAFDDPSVGCVSNLFTGMGAETPGATIESLHLLSFVIPGAVIAAAAGIPCVVGKSMAIRRDVLAEIGGFEAFARVLAEDQAMGLAVREAGHRVVLSPVVVRNVVVHRTVGRALDRQIRWNKIRYAFSKATYCSELLLFPLPFAIAAALANPAGAWWLAASITALRMAQVALLAGATNVVLTPRDLFCIPLFDLLHFAVQFVPFVDSRVTWRGFATRLGPRTVLIDGTAEHIAA